MQNRKSNKKTIHICGNYMHKSGLQVQARFRSALKPGSHGQLNFTLNVQLTFLAVPFKQHDRPSGASNYLSAPAATGIFVLLVCKTLKGEVGPKEEKNLLSLPVLQQTEANDDAHCLYELCPGLVPPNSFKESRFLNH